jgi:uncharacterized protein (DUF305 family)
MEIRRIHLSSLVFALGMLFLAACGTTQQTAAPAPTSAAPTAAIAPTTSAVPTVAAAPTATGATPGMDHGNMPTGDANAPYDAQFIDSMIMHHQGAIDMANQALKEATKPELKTLAENIVTAQQGEIKQMQEWRKAWYPSLAPTEGMGMDMGEMQISSDTSKLFDLRFIEAMISHHQGAITMAKDAQQKAEHAEIKTLAQNIISAQEAEITQMQQWQKEWSGQ